MATNKNPIFLNAVIGKTLAIANADGTTEQTVYAAGADGGAITNMVASTDDTSDVTVVISIDDGTLSVPIGEVVVPAGAGTDGSTPAKDLLDAAKMPGLFQADGSLILGASTELHVNPKSAVTAAKTLNVAAAGGSYSA